MADTTSMTLLRRVAGDAKDDEANRQFVEKYKPIITGVAAKRGLRGERLDEAVQVILIHLWIQLPKYEKMPGRKFRAWLRTLAVNKLRDECRAERRDQGAGGDAAGEFLESVEAREELGARLAEQFDLEVLEMAEEKVKSRVEKWRWDAFCLWKKDGVAVAEVAARLGVKPTQVYQAVAQIVEMLKEVAERLGEE